MTTIWSRCRSGWPRARRDAENSGTTRSGGGRELEFVAEELAASTSTVVVRGAREDLRVTPLR
jgi:hypothetical protein